MTNIHACLVHEKPRCASDLIANLRFLDPDSLVLIYDGSPDRTVLDAGVGAGQDGVIVHPDPRPMRWGRLHHFAFDSLRLAMTIPEFTTLTVVDSDQLATRPGYSHYLAHQLSDDVGCLVSPDGGYQSQLSCTGVARGAWHERALWQPLLDQFSRDDCFPQWTFWPGTVITRSAAPDILRLAELPVVEEILQRTGLWSTEEVLLPSLVALAGHRVEVNPCSYDYIGHRIRHTRHDVQRALQRSDVFWIHPVARAYRDPNRQFVRQHYGYASITAASTQGRPVRQPPEASPSFASEIQPTLPALERIESISGITRARRDLLRVAARQAMAVLQPADVTVLTGHTHGDARTIVVTGSHAVDADATVKVTSLATDEPRRNDATSFTTDDGRGHHSATAPEVFGIAAQRLVVGGLLAWRSPGHLRHAQELTAALARLGLLTPACVPTLRTTEVEPATTSNGGTVFPELREVIGLELPSSKSGKRGKGGVKAYYINLDRRTDRRQQFEGMCRRASLHVERFSAIDGRTADLPGTRGEGDRGIYASLLSHKAVIERARRLCLPEVMIFEDDAEFPEWFVEETDYFLSIVPADWGLIYFGGIGWPRRWSHVAGPVLRCTNIQNIECYVVRNTAYDRVIGGLERASRVHGRWADEVLRDLQHEIPTYTMLNPIVRQRDDKSSDNTGLPHNNYGSRCDIPGWFTDAEGVEYLRQVRKFTKPIVAELGSYKGRSASFIAETVHRRGGLLYCVDLWDCEPSVWGDFEWWMNATGLRHCVNPVRLDTVEAASLFADGHFDIVMHDADHSYEAVKREIETWRPKVHPGGIIMGHDYTNVHGAYPGVRQAVDEICGNNVRSVESLWICEV